MLNYAMPSCVNIGIYEYVYVYGSGAGIKLLLKTFQTEFDVKNLKNARIDHLNN